MSADKDNILNAEVISIDYDSDGEKSYAIKARLLNIENRHYEIITAIPINCNTKFLPVKGEIVQIFKSFSSINTASTRFKTYYYNNSLNLFNNTNNNIKTGTSFLISQKSISKNIIETEQGSVSENDDNVDIYENDFEDKLIQSLQLFPGDYSIEGRYGNTIRFGSTQKNINKIKLKPTWSGATSSDPITIINNAQKKNTEKKKYIELLDNDISALWLTSTQKITLSNSFNLKSLDSDYIKFSSFEKSQAVINAGRVIVNSGVDSVFLLSKKRICLSSTENINIDTKKYILNADKMLHGYDAKEPAVLGIQTERIFIDIIDSINSVIDILTSTYIDTSGDMPDPSNQTYFKMAKIKLNNARKSIQKIKSKVNFVK